VNHAAVENNPIGAFTLKTSKFAEEQILAILMQADTEEKTVAELCEVHGISEASYYK
jgi:hypothetical protein